MARAGLATRVLAIGLLAALLIAGAGGLLLRATLHDIVERGFVQRLDERVERVVARLSRDANGILAHDDSRGTDDFARIYSGWYWQARDATGTLRSRSLWDADLAPSDDARRSDGLLHTRGPRGEPLLGTERHLQVGGRDVVLRAFGPATDVLRELRRIDRVLAVTLAALVVALSIVVLAQVRLGLRPLARLRSAVVEIQDGRRDEVGTGYGAELDPLARELDGVLRRNAQVVARARSHAADLAHALKKPLALFAIDGGQSDDLDREAIAGHARAMNALIDRHLARAGSGAGDRRRVDVGDRVAAMIALLSRLHEARRLAWTFEPPERPVRWRGDATDLEEMLGNLLDHAGKWARSRIEVDLRDDGTECIVCIDDDGPGLDAAQIARAKRRGQRFDESVEGSGLGLAIVADIAHTYGGRLELATSPLGGLRAALRLPC